MFMFLLQGDELILKKKMPKTIRKLIPKIIREKIVPDNQPWSY